MPLRSPGRCRPLRSRAASSVASFDASSTAAREGARLRERYNCPVPDSNSEQQLPMPTDTMANTATQAAYRRPQQTVCNAAALEATRSQAVDTTDPDTDTDTGTEAVKATDSQNTAADSEDEQDEELRRLPRRTGYRSCRTDPDRKAALRASHLVGWGQSRKAAQVLHSTTQLADLCTRFKHHNRQMVKC